MQVSENKKNIERPAVYIGPNINPPFAHWNPATHRSYPGNKNRFAIRKRKQFACKYLDRCRAADRCEQTKEVGAMHLPGIYPGFGSNTKK